MNLPQSDRPRVEARWPEEGASAALARRAKVAQIRGGGVHCCCCCCRLDWWL